MTDEERYYSGSDHDYANEYPLSVCIAAILTTVLAILALEI